MKNKLLGILLYGILIFMITGCENDTIDNKNVSLLIKDGTLTNTKVTLILKNDSNEDYSYGEPYYIEKENNGIWRKLETINNIGFNDLAWGIESKKTVEINVDWEWLYGELKSGKYRIVKEIFKISNSNNDEKFNVYVEFEIKDEKTIINKSELNEINNKIIEYFKTNGVKDYQNYSYNYVDEINGVVVVGLLDNSISEQEKFKRLIVDSELIKFEQGENINLNSKE